MSSSTRPHRRRSIHLGVDLSATTARPAVWRTYDSRPAREFDREAASRLARVAAHGALDLVLLGPEFRLGTSRDTPLGGVLDPAVGACRIAREVPGIGAVAHLDPGRIEPEHVAQALAAVDEHTGGRAGWQVTDAPLAEVRAVLRAWDAISSAPEPAEGEQYVTRDGVRFAVRAARPGARPVQSRLPVVVALPGAGGDDGALELAGHVADAVRVRARTLEEAAVAPQRARLAGAAARPAHPRPPVADAPPAAGGAAGALELAGHVADVVRVRARTLEEAAVARERVRLAVAEAGREPAAVRVLVDLFAVVGPDQASAQA